MSLQGYDSAFQNAVSSFNTRMRAACRAASVRLPVTATVHAGVVPTATAFAVTNPHLFKVGMPIFVTVAGIPVLTRISSLSGALVGVVPLSAAPDVSGNVWIAIDWQPDGARPKIPSYPFVSAQFLRLGSWDANRMRLRSRLQMDVFSNDAGPAGARRVAGLILSELGLNLDTYLPQCEIPQIDTEGTIPIPLLPMDLEYAQGFENFGDSDPNVTHLLAEFNLYHE